MTIKECIELLKLMPHPEGGFYKELYVSHIETFHDNLPAHFDGSRKLATSIYYMLPSGMISKFHRLKSDEIWYFHYGSPMRIECIEPDGKRITKILGNNIDKKENPQIVLHAGTIFGAEVIQKDTFSLIGCMVSPGFEFKDFQLFTQSELVSQYPKLEELIKKFS